VLNNGRASSGVVSNEIEKSASRSGEQGTTAVNKNGNIVQARSE
jgi:hypothetical protein